MNDYIEVPSITNVAFCFDNLFDKYDLHQLLQKLIKNKCIIHILSDLDKHKTEQKLDNLKYQPDIHYHYIYSIQNNIKAIDNYCKIMHCKYIYSNSITYKNYILERKDFYLIEKETDIYNIISINGE